MRYKIKHLFLCLLVFLHCSSANESLKVGAERTNKYFPLLKDKAVGVVGNQSSLISTSHLVDSLLSANIQVLKVFSPEHGFRGTADAGAHIESGIDKQTGLPIISLYGINKKPSPSQLEGLEILVFDIQDVGARFYTYISTLHYVMEAAFVGMHPVPIVHGMTIGEYTQMINGERWLKDSVECDLTVIPMLGYNKQIQYDLPVKPSPNLPNAQAVNLYPSLCLFEGTSVSVGRGTDLPFQHFGAPFIDGDYSFVPESGAGAKNPKYEGERCYGQDLSQFAKLSQLDLSFLIDAYNKCPKKDEFFNAFFDKLAGGNTLRLSIIEGKSEKEIRQSWSKELLEFDQMRKVYLIYQ